MQLSLIGRFLLWSIFWLLALMLPWYYLAPYLAVPPTALAGETMHLLFRWVDGFERNGATATLLTRVAVFVSQGGKSAVADMTPDVNFLTYGYGTVLFWAVMLASRPERLWLKLATGTAALFPVQAWGLCFDWLKELAIVGGQEAQQYTHLGGWQLDAIAYGYQLGILVLTPLVPVVLWLLMDRRFMSKLWVEMSLAGALESGRDGTREK